MEWHAWYPSIHWQHAAFAVALMVVLLTMLLAIPQRRGKRPTI